MRSQLMEVFSFATTGFTSNTNAPESKHKLHKQSAASSSGRNNVEHICKTNNDAIGLKSLADGFVWDARAWNGSAWVSRRCTAGVLCAQVLQSLLPMLPLAPADSSVDGEERAGGRPQGYREFEAGLCGEGPGVAQSEDAWKQAVSTKLPSLLVLHGLYDKFLACDGTMRPCGSKTCCRCWSARGSGGVTLRNSTVACFNHWRHAALVSSAGTGLVRGGVVEEAATNPRNWVLSTASRGNDVEIYVSPAAQRDGDRGVRFTTLGKVGFFFEHVGNRPSRLGQGGVHPPGVVTEWVAVYEYTTAGRGLARRVDASTGCDVFKLRRTFSFFPAAFIRGVVHMVHVCDTGGEFPCRLVRESGSKAKWECNLRPSSSYVLNKYFHCLGRDPVG